METTGEVLNSVGGGKALIRIALSYASPLFVWAWVIFVFILFFPFGIAFVVDFIKEWGKPNFLSGNYEQS